MSTPVNSGLSWPRVARSEWVKLRTLRSTRITLAVALIGLIGVGCLVAYVTDTHFNRLSPAERLTFDPVTRSLVGVFFAQLAVGVLGVLLVTGEYSTGMVRATFAAVPQRLPVLTAKTAVFAVVTAVLMIIGSVAAFLGGQALLGVHGTTLSAPGALRSVIGAGLYLVGIGIIGVGLGFLVRSTAGAIATLFGVLLVLPGIINFLPNSWQTTINPYLPSTAGQAVFTTHQFAQTLSPWTGFAVFCGYAVVVLAAAAVVLRRRDV